MAYVLPRFNCSSDSHHLVLTLRPSRRRHHQSINPHSRFFWCSIPPILSTQTTHSAKARCIQTDFPTNISSENLCPTQNSNSILAIKAAESGKDTVQMLKPLDYEGLDSDELDSDGFPSEADILLLERMRLAEMESSSSSSSSSDCSGSIIVVKSGRREERMVRRSRAVQKISAKLDCSRKKKIKYKRPTAAQQIDESDPLRYLRSTANSSKLLTSADEFQLSEGIQDQLKLEKIKKDLTERFGIQPNFAQWASAAGTDQKLLRRRLNHGSMCKDRMVKSNIRLVISIVRKFQGASAGMNLQDLVQEGCRGLVRGAEKFDATKGFKFSTYAHWWIRQAVRKSLSDHSRIIRLPFHMVDATYRVREARKQLFNKNGRQPDIKEIAEATGLTMKRLQAVLLTPKPPKSLDQKIGVFLDLKPSEVIADPCAETAEKLLMNKFMKQDLNKFIDSSLNPREKQVVYWRFGFEEGRVKTLQEIGGLLGISRERVRQIESSAFLKLKNKKKTKSLKHYLM